MKKACPQKIVILGSTGSLGIQTLEVLKNYPNKFKVIGLSANKNKNLVNKQAKELNVPTQNIVIGAYKTASTALLALASLPEADIVVNVLAGLSGRKPLIVALKSGKTILLGNKESLVAEGKNALRLAKQHNAGIIPLDSEHNAIYEILKKFPDKKVKQIILPCSGGPFYHLPKNQQHKITPEHALNHPRWNMGPKVSIESATLINKGLEILEAHYLFNIPLSKIKIRIHPECQIHGIVEFEPPTKKAKATETYAYISPPDMKEHIENALLQTIDQNSPHHKRIAKIILPHKKYHLKIPCHRKHPGIKLVLKNRNRITKFLAKEERIIQQFLNNKISYPAILEKLST